MDESAEHLLWMQKAVDLARRGEGAVEPNPMVGCVLVRDQQMIGEGWHQRYGGGHAEINALRSVSGSVAGATAYVTLEPCCHTGKTGPCTQALIEAQVDHVVVACEDPNPSVNGQGIAQLENAGIKVTSGILKNEARRAMAPYAKRVEQGLPWVIGKWAMTLDGKIATRTGDSRWISNDLSRSVVHELRGRVDAIVIGAETALADDPMLTARPPGRRVATRVVLDTRARLPGDSKLVQTAREFPLLLAVGPNADEAKCQSLAGVGCEIWRGANPDPNQRLMDLLTELSKREMTNVLVEGGGQLLGSLADLQQIDEIHIFIGPKIVGGQLSRSAVQGAGIEQMSEASNLEIDFVRRLGDDVYVKGLRT